MQQKKVLKTLSSLISLRCWSTMVSTCKSHWECNTFYILHFRQQWNRYIVPRWQKKKKGSTIQFNSIEQDFHVGSDIRLFKTPYTQRVRDSKHAFPTILINNGRPASLASTAGMQFRYTLTPYQTKLSMYSSRPYTHGQLRQSKTVAYCTTLPHNSITISMLQYHV